MSIEDDKKAIEKSAYISQEEFAKLSNMERIHCILSQHTLRIDSLYKRTDDILMLIKKMIEKLTDEKEGNK